MSKLFLDLETYSEVPIKYGTHAYAEKAEVLLFAYAIDDGPVGVCDCTVKDFPAPFDLQEAFEDESVLIVAHNSHFDRTILRHAFKSNYTAGRWRDTMIRALAHGLPGGLGQLCEILNVPTDKAKDKEGKKLINLFCKPRPANMKLRRATRDTHPAEWQRFIEYAALDIEAMRAIDRKLPEWNYRDDELRLWHLDQRINDRGVAVDVELVAAAIRAVDRGQAELANRTQDITFGIVGAATQRDAMLRHILEAYGVDLPDMQASTLEHRLDDPDLPLELKELIAIRLQASSTSTSKYKRLAQGVSSDGRLRNSLQFCGASRTGRWSGRLFQPQNLPRPVLKQDAIAFGIEAMKADSEDLFFDNVMELTSSAVRGCIVAPKGKKLVVADLSNIEGRDQAWLAGEQWKLDAFRRYDTFKLDENGNRIPDPKKPDEFLREGPDLYCLAYAKSFGIAPEDVTKTQRQIGKVQELALGYQGGVGAFITFALNYSIDLDEMAANAIGAIPAGTLTSAEKAWEWAVEKNKTFGLSHDTYVVCDSFKRAWRHAHPHIVEMWYGLEDNARAAIQDASVEYHYGPLKLLRIGNWLRIILPSGRSLCYPAPRVDDEGKLSYMGINQYSRKWQRLKTYGGKLFENVCQAVARDVMANNMPLIELSGYRIVLTVHDEVICEAPDDPGFNTEHLSSLLASNPYWAKDLPLAAGGFEAYRYRKD